MLNTFFSGSHCQLQPSILCSLVALQILSDIADVWDGFSVTCELFYPEDLLSFIHVVRLDKATYLDLIYYLLIQIYLLDAYHVPKRNMVGNVDSVINKHNLCT